MKSDKITQNKCKKGSLYKCFVKNLDLKEHYNHLNNHSNNKTLLNDKQYIDCLVLKNNTTYNYYNFDKLYQNNHNCNLNYKKTVYINKSNKIHLNFENELCVYKDIIIDNEINNVSDLIDLIHKNPLEHNVIYNINLQALHNIYKPLVKLNNMIGLKQLKMNVVDQILYFIQNLHSNSSDYMHTIIYGPPGTGKTELAKIIGKIFSKIGVLKNDIFKKVTRADLIGGYLGQTALKTQEVINSALGGVLFIDEAYSLGNNEKKDSFSKECIDTLCEALSHHRKDLMVIIAGYEKELNDCFFNYNEGLQSRFTWRYQIDNYNGNDLYHIFKNLVNNCGWNMDDSINEDWFIKNIEYFKYFGRDIEALLSKTKIAYSKRVFGKNKTSYIMKSINLEDLKKGLVKFLENNNSEKIKLQEYTKKQIYNSLYC